MNSGITRAFTLSLAIAAALAVPTAVKAQSSSIETEASATSTYSEELSSEYSACVVLPVYGLYCW